MLPVEASGPPEELFVGVAEVLGVADGDGEAEPEPLGDGVVVTEGFGAGPVEFTVKAARLLASTGSKGCRWGSPPGPGRPTVIAPRASGTALSIRTSKGNSAFSASCSEVPVAQRYRGAAADPVERQPAGAFSTVRPRGSTTSTTAAGAAERGSKTQAGPWLRTETAALRVVPALPLRERGSAARSAVLATAKSASRRLSAGLRSGARRGGVGVAARFFAVSFRPAAGFLSAGSFAAGSAGFGFESAACSAFGAAG